MKWESGILTANVPVVFFTIVHVACLCVQLFQKVSEFKFSLCYPVNISTRFLSKITNKMPVLNIFYNLFCAHLLYQMCLYVMPCFVNIFLLLSRIFRACK